MIAINDAYLWAPWADVCYFADAEWWRWHTRGISKPKLGLSAQQVRDRFASFAGQKCTIQQSGADVEDPEVHMLRNQHFPQHGTGISLDRECVVTGSNSGHQGMNIALLAGAAIVPLVAIDGGPAPDGQTHFFGDHPNVEPLTVYGLMRAAFRAAVPAIKGLGVQVVNCSPSSSVDCFEKMDLANALRL